MDQVDSINLTYDYLDECKEYTDSLLSTITGLHGVVEKGKTGEAKLKEALTTQEDINEASGQIIEQQKKDYKRQGRKLKLYKFGATVFGVAAVVLGIIVAIPGA